MTTTPTARKGSVPAERLPADLGNGYQGITRAGVDRAEPLDFDRKGAADLLIELSCSFDGFLTKISFTGQVAQLPALTRRLRELGAEPQGPVAVAAPEKKTTKKPLAPPEYNDAGEAVCPVHHKVLKPSKFSGLYCPVKDPGTGGYCAYKLDE